MAAKWMKIFGLIAALVTFYGVSACIPIENDPDGSVGDDGSLVDGGVDGADGGGDGWTPVDPGAVCQEAPDVEGLFCCVEAGDGGMSDGGAGDAGDGADGGLDLFSCCSEDPDGGVSDGGDGGADGQDGDGGVDNPYCCCGVLVAVAEIPKVPMWQPPSFPPSAYTGNLACPMEGGDTWGVQDDGLANYSACSGNLSLRYPWGTYNSRQAADSDPPWRDFGMGSGWTFEDLMVSEAYDPSLAGLTEHIKLYDQDLLQVGRWTRAEDYPGPDGGIRFACRPGCNLSLTYYPASQMGPERFMVYDPENHSTRIYLPHPLIPQR